MTNEERRFVGPEKCGHCANTAPMEIVASHSQVSAHTDDDSEHEWQEGWVYELLRCPACSEMILRRYYYHDMASAPDDIEMQTLYPSDRSVPLGLPEPIRRAYEAALRVRSVDANAYAVLVGRLLEMICEDRGAAGESLASRLADLSSKGEIPGKLVAVSKSLRQLRNVGAHALEGELTRAELPILDDLARAILEYVYSAPHLVEQAESRLERIKKRKKLKGAEEPAI